MTLLDEPWQLSASVALRPEPFGALAYNFSTRRLTFVKRPELVAVVAGLAEGADVREALQTASVPPEQWPSYVKALASLAEAGTIQPRGINRPQQQADAS